MKSQGMWLKIAKSDLSGAGRNMPDHFFNQEQLIMGINVEMEHTTNPNVAKAIAKDHLMEFPFYYTYHFEMEQELENIKRVKEIYGW
jgi:hypothetical protein